MTNNVCFFCQGLDPMRNFLKTDNQNNRSLKHGHTFDMCCTILRSIFLICLVMSSRDTLAAQQAAGAQARPFARFDGREILFLGLSDQKNVSTDEQMSGYDIISLPCQNNEPNAPLCYYRFAVAALPSLERDLLDDSLDGAWQRWDIVAAALVAEGLSDHRRVDAYRSKIATVVAQIPQRSQTQLGEQQVQAVFETLHQRVLTGKYDVACTNLAQAIDSGDFNCVSATVLFHAMAQQAGLDVRGLEMRGHALSRVRVGQRAIDLETTCADWFKLSERERNRAGTSDMAGYDTRYFAARRQTQKASEITIAPKHLTGNPNTRVLSRNTGDPADQMPTLLPGGVPTDLREISDVQLVATIYYNRGVDELTAGHFGTATVANLKALQLDPGNENAWRNLMATFNNWAIDLASKGNYLDAAQLLDEGRLIDNDYELFRANQVHTYYHWIVDVANRRDYDTTMTLFRLAEERLPNQSNLNFLNYTIRRKMANEFFWSQEDAKAFEQFDAAAKIAPRDINVVEAEVVDVTRHVRQLIDDNRLSRAIWLIDRELIRHANMGTERHVASRPAAISFRENVDVSQFDVQLPNIPEVAPLFGGPIMLDEAAQIGQQIVVTPRRSITAEPSGETNRSEPLPNHGQPKGKTAGMPQPYGTSQSHNSVQPGNMLFEGTQHGNQQGVPVVVSPISETSSQSQIQGPTMHNAFVARANQSSMDAIRLIKPELMTQLQAMRADAVVAWADETLRQRNYPEAIRRLTIGDPPRELLSHTQIERIRQTYREWAATLHAESKHAEAQKVLDTAARSPYLVSFSQ